MTKRRTPATYNRDDGDTGERRHIVGPASGVGWYVPTRMLDKRLSARLRALRLEQGLTVKRVATLLDVSEQHVHGMEGGYGSQPSLATIEDLAHIFKVDECDMFVFPNEGTRHDIREELRRIPDIDAAKLAALLDLMRAVVRSDAERIQAATAVLGPVPRPPKKPVVRKKPRP